MQQKLFCILFVLACCFGQAFGQNRQVSGKVTSVADGSPLGGVSVVVVGTSTTTQTDNLGNYLVTVPNNEATLAFSYIGYVGQRIAVGNRYTIHVQLANEEEMLDEVVVTAMGITRAEKSLGYGTSLIKSDELTQARATNVINAMAGKAPGVRVTSQSGTLGGSSKVVIRGVNSFDGSSPLWVIDGTPVSDGTSAGGATARNIDYGNRIGDLSADDIESMSILKGAAATALYGSRAKDGAIIVTTKKGARNAIGSVTVNSSFRCESPLVLPEFQNEYAQGNYNTTTQKYEYSLKYTNGWGPKIEGQTEKDFLGRDVQLQAYPDNVKDFFNRGHSYINNIGFAGGTDKSDYRLGVTATNETGIIPESKLNRYNFAVNTGTQFSDKLSSRFSGTYSRIDADGRPAQSSNNLNIITAAIYGLPRTVNIHDLKNNFEDPVTGGQIFMSTDRNGNNPYWIMKYNRNSNKVDRFFGTYNLTFKPADWITISNNLGGDIYREKRQSVVRKGTAGTMNGQFVNTDLFYREINNDFMLTLIQDDVVDNFKFSLIVGNNINDKQSENTVVDASNLTIDQLYNYPNAASKTPTMGFSKRRIVGVYGDLGIAYNDYVFLNITGRNDWSSTLPLQNRSYFYPSVSGSFVFTDAWKDALPSWLDHGKLRASWAQVGSDLTPYQLDYQYNPVSTVFMQYVGSATTVFPFSDIATAFTGPRILPNFELKPQRQNSFEIGAELKFFGSSVGLDVNYYNSGTKDQLIPIDVAISTGYFAKWVNVGLVRNKGVEVGLDVIPVKTDNFTWGMDFNFSKNKQVVEELADNLEQYSLASGWSDLQIKAVKGETFGLYGNAFERDEATGKYIIDEDSGLRKTIANQKLGNIYPDWMLGVNTYLHYKSFSVSGLVDIRQGGVFYSGTVSDLRQGGLAVETGGDRSRVIIEDGWVNKGDGWVQNDVAVQSHQHYWSQNYKGGNTEANVFDASYIKLREIRVAYTFPKNIITRQKAFKAAEIGVEGRNLWLIKSKVPHVDPESNFFGAGGVGEGVEFNSIPSTRSFGFNVRLTF